MFTSHSTAAKWNFLQSSLAFFFSTKQGGRKESAGRKKGNSTTLSTWFREWTQSSGWSSDTAVKHLFYAPCPESLELMKLIQNFQESPGKPQNSDSLWNLFKWRMCLPHPRISRALVNAFGTVSHELYSLIIPQTGGRGGGKPDVHI